MTRVAELFRDRATDIARRSGDQQFHRMTLMLDRPEWFLDLRTGRG
jgi:hypothetical protein